MTPGTALRPYAPARACRSTLPLWTERESGRRDLPFDVFARDCPSRGTLEHVTGRWGSLTLGALHEGTFRFNELRRRVDGVSEKMLSQTLHALERDGLVHRDAQPTNPPRVDYTPHPAGPRGRRAAAGP